MAKSTRKLQSQRDFIEIDTWTVKLWFVPLTEMVRTSDNDLTENKSWYKTVWRCLITSCCKS